MYGLDDWLPAAVVATEVVRLDQDIVALIDATCIQVEPLSVIHRGGCNCCHIKIAQVVPASSNIHGLSSSSVRFEQPLSNTL